MAVQLDNNVQIDLADHKGPRGSATLLSNRGKLQVSDGVAIARTGTWHSPHTGTTYTSGWNVDIPSLGVRLRVEPTIVDQELSPPTRGPIFHAWEGAATVTGTYRGARVTGRAYTEILLPPTAPPPTGDYGNDPRSLT
jgi:predicted secreted hydrolase